MYFNLLRPGGRPPLLAEGLACVLVAFAVSFNGESVTLYFALLGNLYVLYCGKTCLNKLAQEC